MFGLARLMALAGESFRGARQQPRPVVRNRRTGQKLWLEELECRTVPTLMGQNLFPADYPWNQNIANAPVAVNSAAVIANIGNTVGIHPDWGEDSVANGNDPLYGIPYNVVRGSSMTKINVIIDNYPDESDLVPVPIPAGAVIEGDYQNGPNPNGGGYGAGQRGDSHLLVWDADTNTAYELYGVTRPTDPFLFPNDNGQVLPHTDGKWHAAQLSVWHMSAEDFRALGHTSADAAGLSILAGLARPDEGLPVSQGGQGAINHALRFTLPTSAVSPQYIYPASHKVNVSAGSTKLPFGSRLRLMNTATVNAAINQLGPQAQVIARAMQQYGLVLADIGSAMFVTGTSAAQDINNNATLTWNMDDVLGLRNIKANFFEVVDLTPVVTGLSTGSGSAGSTVTVNGKNFSGAAGHLSVFFGSTAATSVTYLNDGQIQAVVPSGTGTVHVTVRSGVLATDPNNPNHNVKAPVFGYGTSTISSVDQFTYGTVTSTISATDSTASFAASTVASGNGNLLTLLVKDTLGNMVTGLGSNSFTLSLAGGTSTGTFSAVTASATPGVYTSTFTGSTAGTASSLTVTISGVTLTAHPTVTVTPGALNATASTVSLASSSMVSGSTNLVTLVLKDSAGNAITGLGGAAFALTLSGGTSAGIFGTVTETATRGTYTTLLTASTAGTVSTLTATVNGVSLSNRPTVQVTPVGISATNSTASFATPSVASGNTDLVTILVKDASGNPVTGLGSSAFTLNLSGGLSTGTFSAVTATATPGRYTASLTGVTAGTASSLTVVVSGITLASRPTVTVLPGTISRTISTVTLASASMAMGATNLLTIVLRDSAGNAITGLNGSAFALTLSGGTSAGTFGMVTETATRGTYTTLLTGTRAGTLVQVNVVANSVPLATYPTVQVTPLGISAGNSTVKLATSTVTRGSTTVVTLVIKNTSGGAVSGLPSTAFSLSLAGGTSAGTFTAVKETATLGTYTTTFTATTAGTVSTLTTTVNGVALSSKPTLRVVAPVVSASRSTLSFASSIVALGKTVNLTLVVKDITGAIVSGLASTAFQLAVSGGTSQGTFAKVVETAVKGTYQVLFTGTRIGTATRLTAYVSGVRLTMQPTIRVVR